MSSKLVSRHDLQNIRHPAHSPSLQSPNSRLPAVLSLQRCELCCHQQCLQGDFRSAPLQVPNSSPTAASASSDMYGAATSDACRQLNERLAPYREARPDATFKELINAAYLDRVDLSAHGFYATPDITGGAGAGAPLILSAVRL